MKKLAIVGMGKGWHLAPWKNPNYECWTLNSAWKNIFNAKTLAAPKSVTAWFELHSRLYLRKEWNGLKHHFKALGLLTVPVYVQRAADWPELHDARTFPRRHLRHCHPRGDYHASSFDWMLQFALTVGYKDISIWGVDFGPTDAGEPISARACLEYWIGYAEASGVKVRMKGPTGLFWIYNYTRERTPYHYDDTWRLVEDR